MKAIEGFGGRRLLIFCSYSFYMSNVLVRAFVAEAMGRRGVEACLLVVTDKAPLVRSRLHRRVRWYTRQFLLSLFNWGERIRWDRYWWESADDIARDFGIDVCYPGKEGINSKHFLERLRSWKPNAVLSLTCHQIMKAELLSQSPPIVNYHNSLLPSFGGAYSTEWSVYLRAPSTGYSFHIIDEGVDTGPVLFREPVPSDGGDSVTDLDLKKALAAARASGKVLDTVLSGNFRELSSGPAASYYWIKDALRLTEIADPSKITAAELERRLLIFGRLSIQIGPNKFSAVTAVRRGAGIGPSFQTKDGESFRISRIRGLPILVLHTLSVLRSLGRNTKPS